MQALAPADQPTAGRKGDDAKGQFAYGSVKEGDETDALQGGFVKRHRTKLIFAILAAALVTTGIAFLVIHRWHEEPTPVEQFEDYKVRFKKSYSADEVADRFAAFKENIQEIKRLNNLGGSAKFGWNQWTDMYTEEFRVRMMGHMPINGQESNVKMAPLRASSPSNTVVDWTKDGAVTPVRDQGYCGSCWAFASVATIESRYLLDQGMDGSSDVDDFELSTQQMVSCDRNGWNGGCNGGDPPGAMDWVTDNGGLATAEDYPYSDATYDGSTGSCTNGVDALDGTKVSSWGYATPECTSRQCESQDEETLAASLETYGPLTVCVNASYWQFYVSGVMTSDECGRSGYYALNHCVQLTGFNLDESNEYGKKYWMLRNSWATDWGDEGYINVEYGTNTCGVADETLYVELE